MKDKVAVVTAGAGGIGAATARRLYQDGYKIALLDVADNVTELAESFDGIGLKGTNQSSSDLQNLFDVTINRWGRIDVLVNSAGHYPNTELLETSDVQWYEGLETYFLNIARAVRIVVPTMLNQKAGVIINISTAWAFEPSSIFSPSSAVFRASLATYTKLFSDSYSGHNIRMNNVLPGWVNTAPETEERRISIPMGRFGDAAEVAATVAFLASDDAGYITGQNIRVDGGLMRSVL